MRKKILHLIPTISAGGAPFNTMRTISVCDEFEHECIAKDGESNIFIQNGVRFHGIDLSVPKIRSILSVLHIVKQVKPDIIHVNGKSGLFYGLFVKLIYPSVPIVITYRGFHSQFRGVKKKLHLALERIGSRIFDKQVFVSESEKAYFQEVVKVFSPDKMLIIPNGIKLSPPVITKHINSQNFNLVTIARCDPQKDLNTLIAAFELIGSRESNVTLTIYTTKPDYENNYYEQLTFKISRSRFSNRIFFLTNIDGASRCLSNFDLYLSTSVFEGLPTSVIEAAMARIPIIATNCRGNRDVMRKFESYMVPMQDPVALADKVLKFMSSDLALRNKYTSDIANFCFKNYSIQKHGKDITKLYTAMVS